MSKTTPLSFRVATASDAPLIHPLVESAYRGDESRQGWTTEADIISGKRIDEAGLVEKITHPDGAVLIASTTTTTGSEPGADGEQEVVVACCELARRPNNLAYFGMFAVSPRRQGGGIGRQVMDYAEEYCRREWGTERMEMQVIAGREELVAWYLRRGFRVTGERRPFPVEELKKIGSVPLRRVEDLWFEILVKDLRAGGEVNGKGVGRADNSTPVTELGLDAAVDLVTSATGGKA